MRRPLVVRMYKNVRVGGGVQTRLAELLPRLAEHVDVRVLCYRGRGERADELEAAGVPVDVVPLGVKWSPANVSRYVQYFLRHRPDIVHTHEYTANTLGIAAAARAGVPVRVRHLHSLAPWGWEGAFRTRLRLLSDRKGARRSDVTLAVSEAVRRLWLDRMGLPEECCQVLYNGVDLARFVECRADREATRARLGIAAKAPVVGLVGRLSRGKGHAEFLRVAEAVARQAPSVRFLVVGEGGLRGELEMLSRQLHLSDQVIFTGHRDDVPALLGAMDVFLFTGGPDATGRIQDGLPGVVIEAQAAGLPVVTFRLPMMEEIVADGIAGTLVAGGDVEGAAAACLGYLSDSERADATRRAARRSASRFSLDCCVENTMALYEGMLQRGGVHRNAGGA